MLENQGAKRFVWGRVLAMQTGWCFWDETEYLVPADSSTGQRLWRFQTNQSSTFAYDICVRYCRDRHWSEIAAVHTVV
jgi:hypothetical protein